MLASSPISLESIAAVFDQSCDCVKLVSPDGRLLWMNKGGLCAMELDSFDLVANAEWSGLWPDAMVDQVAASYRAKPPRMDRFVGFCPTAKGTPKWWEVTVMPIKDADGNHFGFIATSRDVTDRETANQTREILLEEMRHRQGNTLALASNLVQLHAHGQSGISDFAREIGDRLAALGRAQSIVGQANRPDDRIEVASILKVLLRPLVGPACTLILEVEPNLFLPAEKLDCVGVVMSEMAVNSGKHGAFRAGGAVTVGARRTGDGIEFFWSEEMQGKVKARYRPGGQGLALMARIATINDGMFDLTWQKDGLQATLLMRDQQTTCAA